jgi:hypothetical protein
MRVRVTATLKAALMIAAISSLPGSASARTCKCDCYSSAAVQGPERVDIDLDSNIACSAANGRYCALGKLNVADAGSRGNAAPMSRRTRSINPMSGSTSNCSAPSKLFDFIGGLLGRGGPS